MFTSLLFLLVVFVVALAIAVVSATSAVFAILLGLPVRIALRIRMSPLLRRLMPDAVLMGAYRLTPVGGGMGNLLLGGGNLYGGTGVPTDAAVGGAPANGDFYFRIDGAATTCIYQRRAGAWVATAA